MRASKQGRGKDRHPAIKGGTGVNGILIAALIAVLAASFLISPRARSVEGFFAGRSPGGAAPGVWTLTLSQVTTWIFARSLMNAAILGYFYGLAGSLAYAAYYLSFLTGFFIVDQIRFRHGHDNVQGFLAARFGPAGAHAYNLVIAVRLLSEVFANLLVVGLVFGIAGTTAYNGAIIAIAAFTLGYSMIGGLHSSLRTDVLQMLILLAALVFLLARAAGLEIVDISTIAASSPDIASPGWVLLAVALLQVWSYPLHDPVMMDRGFLADRATTRKSFLNACWISFACILAFGLLGVLAGLAKLPGEDMIRTMTRLFGEPTMVLFNLALVISAISTLDSTFSSAAKLAVVDMGLAARNLRNGRIAMAVFLIGGLAFLFLGSKDLFAAVAVSGTASMFLAPVVIFSIWLDRDVEPWAFALAFAAAMAGAALYFLESNGYVSLLTQITGLEHKYSKLLVICIGVLAIGMGAFALALKTRRTAEALR